MAKIALCWELGAGAGHLKPLADHVKCISSLGVKNTEVSLISRRLDLVQSIPEFDGLTIIQAPFSHSNEKSMSATNYSGLMTLCGYQSDKQLVPLLKQWVQLFKQGRYDLIITDHSPTAVLAARVLEIPTIMTGIGFSVPMGDDPMPSLRPWESVSKTFLESADSHLLKVINSSLNQLGYAKFSLEKVADLFTNCEQWIMSHPKLDPYVREDATYLNLDSISFEDIEPQWPDVPGDKVFCYFQNNSPHLRYLLQSLLELGVPSLVVVRGLPETFTQQFVGSNVRIQAEFVDVKSVAAQCQTVICHGGQGVVRDFLRLGIPPIILPDVLERTLFAYRIGSQGLGFAGTPDASKIDLPLMIETSKNSPVIWRNAEQFAFELSKNDDASDLQALLINKFSELGLR